MAKKLDYETVRIYNLEITITDSSPEVGQRRSIVARVDVRVTNINDSGSYDAEVRVTLPRIACAGSTSSRAGVPTSSPLEIVLVDEKDVRTIITTQTERFTFDDTKSNNLFTADIVNGVPHVQANSAGRIGKGKLIVNVQDVYPVEVEVSVVALSSLVLKAAPYPTSSGSTDVVELKQVVPGKFQEVLLETYVRLTDGYLQKVSTLQNTSIEVTNAADFSGGLVLGPSPKNLFTLKSSGHAQRVLFKSYFEGHQSNILNLTVSADVLNIAEIVKLGLQGINSTLKGVIGKTTAYPYVELKMDDGSFLRVENFSHFSGLLNFSLSNTTAAQLNLPSGEITLLGNENIPVTITATSSKNSSITATFELYCNPEPDTGEIDIGAVDGPAIVSLANGQKWTLAVRTNAGVTGLFAVDIQLTFNPDQLQFDSIATEIPFDIENNHIRIFGPVGTASALKPEVAGVVFVSRFAGLPSIDLKSYTTVDRKLNIIPNKQVSSCNSLMLGDFNSDCTLNIVDVAYILGYSSSTKTGFTDPIGQAMQALQPQKSAMDVNWNKDVSEDDAILLSEIFLGHAKFISDLSLYLPDHRSTPLKCDFELKVKLKNKDGSTASSVDISIYYDITHSEASSQTQFDQTTFDTGSKVATKGNAGLFGGVLKSEYSSADGFYRVVAVQSKLESEQDFGVTVIQVVTGTNQKKFVVPMFVSKTSPMYTGTLDLQLESGVRLQASNGYSPQRMVNLTESTERCKDPILVMKVQVTLNGEYADVVEGREEEAKIEVLNRFNALYTDATFTNVRLEEGSVIAKMDMKVSESKKDPLIEKLKDDVKNGLEVTMNGKTVSTLPTFKVDGQEHIGQASTEAESGKFDY